MTDPIRVAVVFGGRSGEHDISILSAESVVAGLARPGYEVVPVGIDRQGNWKFPCSPDQLRQGAGTSKPSSGRPDIEPLLALLDRIDIIFPVLHGPYGEDGTIQGLLEMAGVPFVGSGVLGSAAGMDKAVMKSVFARCGIRTPDWSLLRARQWRMRGMVVAAELIGALGLPLFVKPANMGSSVGVSKVFDEPGLVDAIDAAFGFDDRVICERAVQSPRELEIAILGNDDPRASAVGEVFPGSGFYDYEAKYGDSGSRTMAPADLSDKTGAELARAALRAYRELDLAGLARVDFLLEQPSGRLFMSEVNTMPGFTPISMYPKLWSASGLPYPDLLARLIELGMDRHRSRAELSPS